MNKGNPNRLTSEKSPYLLQHACNPVDWYPWANEAFEKAKSENKLMFLSIGYSTCHWCHVMAHEAFSNAEIAEFLNDNYVSIKVDREERPDIDETYMLACQLLSPNCGWPLNVILIPDFKPVWAGSYFPVESKYGLPAFIDVLKEINHIWQENSNRILEIGELVSGRMREMQESIKASEYDKSVLDKAVDLLKKDFDPEYGGFDDAPKFPTPHKLSFLLRIYKLNSDNKALEIVEKTLQSMYQGGIFDHVGGGFHRYSTDKKWLIPHFEKMLYDQALITIAYLEAYQVTGNQLYAEVARKTLDYVLKELTNPEGGFFAGVDADSEGEEGKFYVWTKAEVDRILGSNSEEFCKYFDISQRGNFQAEKNVLHISESINQYDSRYESSMKKLYEERNRRIHPHKDRKIIASWNGLMIKAFAMAGKVLNEDKYKLAAIKAGEFIMDKLSMPDGRLLRRYYDGDVNINGFVEDYAFLVYGFLELYQATFDTVYLKLSIIMTNRMIADFQDEENGGFYLTSKDIETPILKRKDAADEAMPSGNSIAALILQELADITETETYLNLAVDTIKAFSYDLTNYPTAYAQLLIALIYYFGEHRVFLVSENPKDKETNKIIDVLNRKFLQDSVVLFKQAYNDDIDKIYESAQYKNAQDHKTLIYVCEKSGCRPSLKGISEVERFLVENKL